MLGVNAARFQELVAKIHSTLVIAPTAPTVRVPSVESGFELIVKYSRSLFLLRRNMKAWTSM
jgi:hypothetical protein